MAESATASDYVQLYGMYWHNQPDSFAFNRWLSNHPRVLAERGEIMECKEAVLWENDTAIQEIHRA